MTKHILAAVAAMLIFSAFGYGWGDAVGAWAFESSQDKPFIAVTNNTVWLLENGVWKPGTTGSPQEYGTCFSLSVDEAKRDYAIWKPYRKWEFEVDDGKFTPIADKFHQYYNERVFERCKIFDNAYKFSQTFFT